MKRMFNPSASGPQTLYGARLTYLGWVLLGSEWDNYQREGL